MATTVEQLQQLGLNKYEAEAYYTLLKHGPLTGYEVGKQSQVPLSRSYDVLERLVERGLALLQPGEPARYSARDPRQFLGQVRATMEETLTALSTTLTALSHADGDEEFWVVRGRQNIIERAREMINATQSQLALTIPPAYHAALADQLTQAHQRGASIYQRANQTAFAGEHILLLRDDSQALLGTLQPSKTCQAIVSANSALLIAMDSYFGESEGTRTAALAVSGTATETDQPDTDWMDWETRKHDRLRILSGSHRVA